MANILAIVLLTLAASATWAVTPVYIGLDAEFSPRSSSSAQAIQQGIEIAIDEINRRGGVLKGRPLKLLTRDNRATPSLGIVNLRELAGIKDLVAVFGGRLSPTYIECLPTVHELGIPLLDPWGSADQITDHTYKPSYTFRLSLKDTWAGVAFIRHAKDRYKAERLGLLLPNTPWGRSNQTAIRKAAVAIQSIKIVGERWFNWGDPSLISQYKELLRAGAQAIVFVATEIDAATLIQEVASLPESERLPIISHFGMTGSSFATLAGESLRRVDLSVIQTYSFIGQNTATAKRVLAALQEKYEIATREQIKSPIGVAHAYDLTHLLVNAINAAGSTDRRKIRDALESLAPHDGLIQRYARPFSHERHDALSARNVFFARYLANDVLMPIERDAIVASKHRR